MPSLPRGSVWALGALPVLKNRVSFPQRAEESLIREHQRAVQSEKLSHWLDRAAGTTGTAEHRLPSACLPSHLWARRTCQFVTQVLWTAVVADMLKTILGCSTMALSSEQRWMHTDQHARAWLLHHVGPSLQRKNISDSIMEKIQLCFRVRESFPRSGTVV